MFERTPFEGTQTVLIQFRFPLTADLPDFIREDARESDKARIARRMLPTTKPLLLRNGAIASGVLTALNAAGLSLVDARSQVRTNDMNQMRQLVTFTFKALDPVTQQRHAEIVGPGMTFLESQLTKRWNEVKVTSFAGKDDLRVMNFTGEAEHPLDPREVPDQDAESYGLIIMKSKKKLKQKAA